MPRTFPTLDAFYYLDHFNEMLEFVEGHCRELLGENERAYIERFRGLSREAQGLHVRMSNRRGIAFRPEKFAYAEITNTEAALDELARSGFVQAPQETHYAEVITTLTKAELLAVLGKCGVEGLASRPKKDVVREGVERVAFAQIVASGSLPEVVVQRGHEVFDYIQFLYFGHRRSGMQVFAMRDLGIVKTRGEESGYKPRFSDAATARAAFFYSVLRERIDECEVGELEELARQCCDWPRGGGDEVDRRFHRTIAKLGMGLERGGSTDLAGEVYSFSDVHPARERRCRILMSAGEREAAAALLDEIVADPSSDDELLFAEDFHARKFGGNKRSKLTEMLRASPVIEMDEAFRDSAENAAVEHYRSVGMVAYRTENQLWSLLFHALFWEEIFDGEGGVTPNPFDPRPTQWIDGSFAMTQRIAIEVKLARVLDGSAMAVVDAAMTKLAASDGRFLLTPEDGLAVKRFLELAPPRAVVQILRRILDEPLVNRSGFPDLMLVADGAIRFVEVKGEGDQLRRNQLAQLVALENAGFDVGVVRVQWCVDPMQEYVVVDIETTGGRAEHHRITEVAAVKMRGGEMVERYQTLVNPERRIPRMITSLTGISDEMVAEAPVFAEVAEKFREFVGGAVFVAHNAKFDYGFLRQEFRRMGEAFRCPTLCTVVAMRKYYPGLESYKLSRLCAEFGISLDQHHRALCDAEATAELLKLINGKRVRAGG